MLTGKNIVLGVTGGIAVYKAVEIVSRLKKLNADVKVIMTSSAEKFVAPLTFQTMSQNYVVSNMFGDIPSWDVEHISLAKSADLFLVAPATANIIGKVANGIADDMLSTTIMATQAQVIFAPAMNTNMYNNTIFKLNREKLEKLGYRFISPASGRLACGDSGEGKLESPENIVKYILEYFSSEDSLYKDREQDFLNKKIIITAGPTIARLDPVRYITNNSSGKMGYELAKAARDRGGKVILITGPTSLDKPEGMDIIEVETTEDMYDAINEHFNNADILIKAAAPLDYKPLTYSEQKIKKSDGKLNLTFDRSIDIAEHFGKIKGEQKIIGFAAESENLLENAKGKLDRKKFDIIVANDISKKDSGFKSDYNEAIIIDKNGNTIEINKSTKRELSEIILDEVIKL